MPVKIVKKADLDRRYPPDGIPTAKNQKPDDFLFQACSCSVSIASLQRALDKKANVNARDKNGLTPLMHASVNWTASQYIPFLTKLLEHKAEPNVENAVGNTALDLLHEKLFAAEAAREKEIKEQLLRREIMEGRGPTGYGFGTAEDQRKTLIPNQPLADELDTFRKLPQLYEGKQLLEKAGALPGEAPFKPAYLTTEEFVEKRDRIIERYKDPKYKMYVGQ